MSDLTMHLQRVPEWWPEFVNRCKGNLKYVVGVDVFPDYGDVECILRTYLLDSMSNALVDAGASGADSWIEKFASVYAQHPGARIIGPNEYVLWSPTQVDNFNAFHVRFIERMSQLGHPVMCGQINTGWPHLRTYNDPPPYPESLAPTLAALWAHGGWFSTHEYWPGLDDPKGNILRYRDIRLALLYQGVINLPDFFVSELGVDLETTDPDSDYGHWGWSHFMSSSEYLSRLQWYSKEMDKDPYMRGASIFTEGGGWDTFELDYSLAMALADFIGQDEPAPPPEKARGLDVNQFSGEINWDLVAQDYSLVGIRASGPNADRTDVIKDTRFEDNYAGAGAAGLLRLAYHGLYPGFNKQANLFVESVNGRPLEMGWYSDLEILELTDDKCRVHLEAMDRLISESYGIPLDTHTGVYTSPNFMSKHTAQWAEGRNLWIAHWTYDLDVGPIIPKQWSTYKLWQWSNQGTEVPGIDKRVCLDVYNGTEQELQQEYGGDIVVSDVRVFDAEGKEKDWAWLVENYGPMTIQSPGDFPCYRVVELREKFDDSAFVAQVRAENGVPMQGVDVVFYWDTADPLPDCGWLKQGVKGPTNENGDVGFGMGPGAYYTPPKQGPHKAWICGEGKSEMLEGIGMIAGTNHNHIDAAWQWVEDTPSSSSSSSPSPSPSPSPEPTGKFRVTGTITVDLIVEALEE